jgi:uncharacterized protein YukE
MAGKGGLVDKIKVTPQELTAVAGQLLDTADEAHRNSAQLDGEQLAPNGSARGFDSMTAAAACAESWVQAIEVSAAKLALDADNLKANATTYAYVEQTNQKLFSDGQGAR